MTEEEKKEEKKEEIKKAYNKWKSRRWLITLWAMLMVTAIVVLGIIFKNDSSNVEFDFDFSLISSQVPTNIILPLSITAIL
mgnify:CR=1 FL=1